MHGKWIPQFVNFVSNDCKGGSGMDDLGEFLFIVLSILIDRILPKRFHAWLDRQHKYIQNFFIALFLCNCWGYGHGCNYADLLYLDLPFRH